MLQELFSGPVGLLSIFTIGFILVMAVFLILYFKKKIAEDEQGKR